MRIIVRFQQSNRQDSQKSNNDTFYRPPVPSAQCITWTEKYPDSAILMIYDDDEYSQGYGHIKEVFRALSKDHILHSFISDHDYRSSNEGNDIGYNFYVFDIRYQKNIESAQLIKVEFKFYFSAGIYAYAQVLTRKVVIINSDGQRHFDLN